MKPDLLRNIISILMIFCFFSISAKCAEDLDIKPSKYSGINTGCFTFPDDAISRSDYQTDETKEQINRSIHHFRAIFEEQLHFELNRQKFIIAPAYCNGDDAISFSFKHKDFTIEAIDSRIITVIVKGVNLDIPMKRTKLSDFSLDNYLRTEILDLINELFKIQEPIRWGGLVGESVKSYVVGLGPGRNVGENVEELTGCWISENKVIFLFTGHTPRAKIHDPEPIIKFPKLRKKLGIKATPREDLNIRIRSPGDAATIGNEDTRMSGKDWYNNCNTPVPFQEFLRTRKEEE